MIRHDAGCFALSTGDTTYAFRVRANGLLEHLYYGERIELLDERKGAGEGESEAR